ncbi:MAG TPA: glycogen debranching protein [Phycisphaerales bacterium]|nr:glycogen debranching protein [Phycisphaerales bacterium]
MSKQTPDLAGEGFERAMQLLYDCATPDGFLASPTENANYHRIWARDGGIATLAALLSDDHDLISTARATLLTLARHQGPHGEIPSNVDPVAERVSYGGTAGRVDAGLWFVIACGEYWHATSDEAFLGQVLPSLEKVRFLLGAWEFNARGLLFVPPTGDWADEYLHSGYVLYDQLLYLQAQRTLAAIHRHLHGGEDHALQERISRLGHLIRANYWFDPSAEDIPDDAYHEVLYRMGRAAASPHCAGNHWMPFFSPHGYGYRFDALANVLVSLLGIATEAQRERVDRLISDTLLDDTLPLLPAFHPVIKPVDEDWSDLQMTFSYTFKNHPYEYHNGGLWPMVTGFYVADLAARDRYDEARRLLDAIHRANAMEIDGEPWSFPEYVNGKTLQPGGTRCQGWSAAAAIIGQKCLEGRRLFTLRDHGGMRSNR